MGATAKDINGPDPEEDEEETNDFNEPEYSPRNDD